MTKNIILFSIYKCIVLLIKNFINEYTIIIYIMDIKEINFEMSQLKSRYPIKADQKYWNHVRIFAMENQIHLNKLLLIAVAIGIEELKKRQENGELKVL